MAVNSTGLVFSDRYLQHNTNPYRLPSGATLPFVEPVDHPSNPRLVERTKKLLDYTGLSKELVRVDPYLATPDDLSSFHPIDYVDGIRQISESGGGDAGQGAPVGADSYEIALLAAGGVMAAVDAVMNGEVRQCFALVRPPGHHAEASKGRGFCIFGNVAIAARHAQRRYGVERVMIVDWDVHHGNGTQSAFYDDPNVLFVSLQQDRLFPIESGMPDEIGSGAGAGYTVNLALPAGSGGAAYRSAFERVIEPLAEQFKPELVFVSAGQDGSASDPLGRMLLATDHYRELTAIMQGVAERTAQGRLVLAQEGGYSEIYGPYCTLAIFETLTGHRTGIEEPTDPVRVAAWPASQSVSGDQSHAIDLTIEQLRPYWEL
ncbi:MAG: class II histone deacetylase [Nitrolancea sp.]